MSVLPSSNPSYWWLTKPPYAPLPPLAGEQTADVAIIGGGFTGVSTALAFSERFPERRIVLLEARHLGYGASGRNSGMMLNFIPGTANDPNDLAMQKRVYDVTRRGIAQILATIDRLVPETAHRRDGCLEVFTDPRRADAAATEVERLRQAGLPLRFLDRQALAAELDLQGVSGAILDPGAGLLDGVDYLRRLRPVLLERGVAIYEDTPVLRIAEGKTHTLTTPQGQVHAAALVLATNAYTPRLGYFRDRLFPLLSSMVATAPLSPQQQRELGWPGAISGFSDDLDRIAFGTMSPQGALLFGGGSNAAYQYGFGGRTSGPVRPRTEAAITARLQQYLPGARDVPISHRWNGPLALTFDRCPMMGVCGAARNVYYALGYSGHGVTLANLAGLVLCDLYSGDDSAWRGLPFYPHRPPRLPPEPLRFLGYHAYTMLTGRSPRRR